MTILETIPIMKQAGKYIPMMVWSVFIAVLCLFIAGILFKNGYDMGGMIFYYKCLYYTVSIYSKYNFNYCRT